ncbi:unnamed protein product [Gongylonema pulchrum]|uniref:Uncharacterized protein n=1 Tax=Gongylonema pulchrum TaxID=637853 RepID=A0A183DXQ9_9BILA|nr:unnamed protein product [Gongylonema pulchrum]
MAVNELLAPHDAWFSELGLPASNTASFWDLGCSSVPRFRVVTLCLISQKFDMCICWSSRTPDKYLLDCKAV